MLDVLLQQYYAGRVIVYEYFDYAITFDFTVNTTLQDVINIDANLDFIIQSTSMFQDSGSGHVQTYATQELFDGTVLIKDTGTGKQFSNQPIYAGAMFGTGQFPFVWPEPRLVRGKSTLQVQASVLDGSTPKVQLTFHGVNVIDKGPAQ